jgi:hypothetical protein
MSYEKLDKIITSRARHVCASMQDVDARDCHVDTKYWIAGGCLTGTVNDIDIFPAGTSLEDSPFSKLPLLSQTKNAGTFKHNPTIQFCKYRKPSLIELVNSFDFAHIQVGAVVRITKAYADAEHPAWWTVDSVYYTDDFVEANAGRTTWFTGSEYPLSSLIRLGKYYKREIMPKTAYMCAVIDCMAAITKRGFKDYADFKDQLDAVDLGLLPEEMRDLGTGGIMDLYRALTKDMGKDLSL